MQTHLMTSLIWIPVSYELSDGDYRLLKEFIEKLNQRNSPLAITTLLQQLADCERLKDSLTNSPTKDRNRFLSISVDGNVFGRVGSVAG
jgi:hypothetical protein